MCSNYQAVTRADRLLSFFNVFRAPEEPPLELQEEVWPTGLAPFIRRAEDGSGNRLVETGHFGLVPSFAKELAFGRRAYNARTETVATLASFKHAWANGQRCIVPAEAIYEPCYESGKPVRHRIFQEGDVPLGIAGIYRRWRDPAGPERWTFAMLTVNADRHPVFQRMHKPGDEKRMVVILEPAEYDRWLQCSVAEAATFFRQWQRPLRDSSAPLPPRAKAAAAPKLPPAPPADPQGGLLGGF
jgi:putative SOS response-associated peptidase YedK